jgi:hypothetical protein
MSSLAAQARSSTLSAGPSRWIAQIVIALVASIALLTWLLTGVPILDAARYLSFECLFVLIPGCTLYALLGGRDKQWLRILAIGWPLGYAIEIGAFALTAALGRRQMFLLLPLLALASLGALLYSRRISYRSLLFPVHSGTESTEDRRLALVVVGSVASIALLILALESFMRYPLPQHTSSVVYFPDNVFDISIAAQVRNHWPVMEPYVAGQVLHYYTAFFMHAAAINQVTGIPFATIVLRLFPTTITLLTCLQLWLLGRELGNSRWAGTLTVALFFPVNDLNLDATKFEAFGTTPFNQLSPSPTYALGIPFFLALLVLMQRQLAVDRASDSLPPPRSIASAGILGPSLITGILVLGGAAAKTIAIADFIGGLGLFWLWRVVFVRDNRMLPYLVISTISAAVIYHVMLSGGVSAVRIRPLDFVHFTLFISLFPAHSALGLGVLICAATITCAFLFLPALGALWTVRNRSQNVPFVALLVAVFIVSASAYVLLEAAGDGQLFFMDYGSLAIMPVASVGLIRLWSDTPHVLRAKVVRACLIMLILGLALAASTRLLIVAGGYFGLRRIENVTWVWTTWYVVAYGLTAGTIAFFCLKLERQYASSIRSRATRVLACAIPLVLTLGLVKSLGVPVAEAWKAILGKQVTVDSSEHRGLTAALYSGLLWVRDHTGRCDILAVNNHSISAKEIDSKYFYYSAFTERSVYLESWAYTSAGVYGGQPFPARLALNNRAVLKGEPDALRELAQRGVGYVLIDKLHGTGADEPVGVSRLVFDNSALEVYRLTVPIAPQPRSAACGIPANV